MATGSCLLCVYVDLNCIRNSIYSARKNLPQLVVDSRRALVEVNRATSDRITISFSTFNIIAANYENLLV